MLDNVREREVASLFSFNVSESHTSSSPTVLGFLSGLAAEKTSKGASTSMSDDSKTQPSSYQFSKTVESVLNLTYMNAILPAHFRESVLLYTLTGSKLALKVVHVSAGGSYASYSTVKNWFSNLSMKSFVIPPGKLVVAFDNNQVLQRRWKVLLKNEVKCNIVTVVAVFCFDDTNNIQTDDVCSPAAWSQQPLQAEQIQHLKYPDKENNVKTAIMLMSIISFKLSLTKLFRNRRGEERNSLMR